MKPIDSYENRLKMVEMHSNVLERIDTAIKKQQSIKPVGYVMPASKAE